MLLYIHIPYCDSKCHYCAFNSYVDKFDTRATYMKSLEKQLMFEIDRFNVGQGDIDTLFIGGGTPSTVAPSLYKPIFDIINPYLSKNAEMTTEANPNSASREWLSGMQSLGINRISFGVQSFDEKKLKALNRAHTPKQAKDAVLEASKLGFWHISLDLIYNYKGDTKELIEDDINQAFELPIDHISAYELTIEDGTRFASTPKVKQEDEEIAFFVSKQIEKRGFIQYEISNFGRYRSSHNIGYWRLKDYIGVGAGAVGFLKNKRFYPHTDIDSYIKSPTHFTEELLSDEDMLTEKIFLGLRSFVGVEKSILTEYMQKRAQVLCDEKKLSYKNGIFYNKNYFLSDELALYLLT